MSQKQAALVFIGAKKFKSDKLASRQAFLASKNFLQEYFESQELYRIVQTLDLFDSDASSSEQVGGVDKFVGDVSAAEIEYFFVVYIGHGIMRANKDDYFWAIAETNKHNPYASSIDVNTLGHSLKKLRQTTKCICLVDGCFSAATAGALQSDQALDAEVSRRTKAAISHVHGSLVISSSAVDKVSYISGVEEKTLFGRALSAVLMPSQPVDNAARLDAATLIDRCERWMEQEEPDRKTSPQIIAPFQQGRPLMSEELFPVLHSSLRLVRKTPKVPTTMKKNEEKSEHYPTRDEIDAIRDVVRCGRELEKELVLSIDKSLLKEDLYAYYARTKGVEAVARKIERKRAALAREGKDEKYEVASVTDVVGLRLITLFRDDIAGILHGLCTILVGTNGKREEFTRYNPFVLPPEIKEARAYFSETFPGAHSYAVDAQEILSSYFDRAPHNISAEIIPRDEYSSVHIVLRTDIGEAGEPVERAVSVPVEFQVRSVFEDTWAQIDHKLRYTRTRVSSEGDEIGSYISEREDIPPTAERSLKLLKRFLDNSGDLAEIIRDEVEDTQPDFSKPTPSMDSADDFATTIAALGADPAKFDDFRSMLLRRDELDRVYTGLGTPESADQAALEKLRKAYGKLAEDINLLFESPASRERFIRLEAADDAIKFYFYSLRMEEAFCRVFSARPGDLSEIKEARNIYSQLTKDFSDYAPLHYRMAQAQKSTGDLGRAISSMEKAIHCLESGNYLSGEYDHKLTEKQFKTLINNADRVLGFYVWAQAHNVFLSADDDQRLELVDETIAAYDRALQITLRGLERSEDDMRNRNLNNIVAYLNDSVVLLGGFAELERLVSISGRSYQEFFDELASLVDIGSETSIKRLETLATGYSLLGQRDEALKCANRIVNVITKNKLIASGEIPADEIQEILDIAIEIRTSG